MSTIRVRRLDENWDPVYGSGRDDYIYDIDAIVQIIQSRMRLWLEEWWEDLTIGLPMFQSILGKMGTNKTIIDKLIHDRIAETVYVTGVVSFDSSLDTENRSYECTATVNTKFGLITITNGGD